MSVEELGDNICTERKTDLEKGIMCPLIGPTFPRLQSITLEGLQTVLPSYTTLHNLHRTLHNLHTTLHTPHCTHPSVVLSPALHVLVRVRPQQVAEQPRVRDVCRSHDPSDLLHALEIRTETSVTTEDLLVHNGCDGQTVEAVSEGFPQFDVVASLACDEILNNVDFTLT